MFDTDGSGSIDAKEIRNVLKELGIPEDMIDFHANNLMADVDTDGDKKISYSEFKAAFLKK